MKWTPYDKSQITNLVIALKKAKFEMTGMEVVAFADVFKWVSSLHDYIEQEVANASRPPVLTPDKISKPEDNKLADAPKEQPSEKPKKDKKKSS